MRHFLALGSVVLAAGCTGLLDLERFAVEDGAGGGAASSTSTVGGGEGGAATTAGTGGVGGTGAAMGAETGTWCSPTTTRFEDNFNRTAAETWSLPVPNGVPAKTYNLYQAGQRFSVDGERGNIAITNTNRVSATLDFAELGTTLEVNASIEFNKVASAGANASATVMLLHGDQAYYEVRLVARNQQNNIILQLVEIDNGVGSNLAGAMLFDTSPTVGTPYHVRFRIEDFDLKVAVWRDDEPEPSEWTMVAAPTVLPAGREVGVSVFSDATPAQNLFALFDDLKVCTPPP